MPSPDLCYERHLQPLPLEPVLTIVYVGSEQPKEDWIDTNLRLPGIGMDHRIPGETDEVPEYIIGEFSVDLKEGEEVEIHCPYCNGTMQEARNIPSDD